MARLRPRGSPSRVLTPCLQEWLGDAGAGRMKNIDSLIICGTELPRVTGLPKNRIPDRRLSGQNLSNEGFRKTFGVRSARARSRWLRLPFPRPRGAAPTHSPVTRRRPRKSPRLLSSGVRGGPPASAGAGLPPPKRGAGRFCSACLSAAPSTGAGSLQPRKLAPSAPGTQRAFDEYLSHRWFEA